MAFVVELFAPFTFALTNTATPSSPFDVRGICELNEMTPEQTMFFWQQVQGFRGDQVNGLSGNEEIQNKPSQVVNNIFIGSKTEGVYPLDTATTLMGFDEEQKKAAAAYLNKKPTDRITDAEARDIAKRFKNDAGVADLLSQLKGSPSEENPAFEGYKLRTNAGGEIPLSALQDSTAPDNPNAACLLDSQHITGKVSYVGSLSKDVTVAYSGAPNLKGVQNGIGSTDAVNDLDLQGASTLVLPKQYEETVKRLKTWVSLDTWLTVAQMGFFFGKVGTLTSAQEKLKEIETRKQQFAPDSITFSRVTSTPLKREIYGLGSAPTISKSQLESSLTKIENGLLEEFTPAGSAHHLTIADIPALKTSSSEFASRYAAIEKVRSEIPTTAAPAADVSSIYRKYEADFTKTTGGFDALESAEVTKAQVRSRLEIDSTKTLNELAGQEYTADLNKIKKLLAARTGEVWYRLVLGMGWLGPGRFVFEITDAITFQRISQKQYADNYITVFANNNDLIGEFRRATDWVSAGTVTDALSDFTDEGIPSAAYQVGNLWIANQPLEGAPGTGANSITSFRTQNGQTKIESSWKGKSDILIAEQLSSKDEYARLPIEVKDASWSLKIKARKEFQGFYAALNLIAPLISWKLSGLSDASLTAVRLVVYDFYIREAINPAQTKPDEKCDPKVVDSNINKYIAATAANQLVGWLPIAKTVFEVKKGATTSAVTIMRKIGYWPKLEKTVTLISGALSPTTLVQGHFASEALQYASNCKDDHYTILAYQSLKHKTSGELTEKLKSVSSNDVLSNLNLGKAISGVGQPVDTTRLREYVNLRGELENQASHLVVDKIYYLQLKDATREWIPTDFAATSQQPNMCPLRKVLDSDNKAAEFDKDGVRLCDKKTGVCTQIANSDRSLNHKQMNNLALTLIPNKYVTASFAGCAGNVLEMDAKQSITLAAGATCAGASCIRSQIQYATGRQIGSDLTSVLGRVTQVYTTDGSLDFSNGVIIFSRNSAVKDEFELRSPGNEVMQKATSSQEENYKQAAAIDVTSDGRVTLQGYIHSDSPEAANAGELRSILTERGKINYLANGEVQIFIHTLAQVDAGLIQGFGTAPVQRNDCSDGLPGIKITRVEGHAGVGDAAAAELQSALDAIQGCSGMHILDTPTKQFMITKDANGNPILRVIDKQTGEIHDYPITGPLRREGNDIVIPTDKGDFKFNIGMGENGQPQLSYSGPDELKGLEELLKAKGTGGILVYDPQTGQLYGLNGQDLAMNPRFATDGERLSRDSNGNFMGNPGSNLLLPTNKRISGSNGFASLPGWPTELPALILAILATIAAVTAIRIKKQKRPKQ